MWHRHIAAGGCAALHPWLFKGHRSAIAIEGSGLGLSIVTGGCAALNPRLFKGHRSAIAIAAPAATEAPAAIAARVPRLRRGEGMIVRCIRIALVRRWGRRTPGGGRGGGRFRGGWERG